MSAADEAWEAHRGLSDLWMDKQEAFIRGFDAGTRRALEDAADDATLRFFDVWTFGAVSRWLRARAAAVAPRETKD